MTGNIGDGPMEGNEPKAHSIRDRTIFGLSYVYRILRWWCIFTECIHLDSSVTLNSDKENRTILERFGYTVGTQIGSGSYAKVKVKKKISLHCFNACQSIDISFVCPAQYVYVRLSLGENKIIIEKYRSFTVGVQFAVESQRCSENHSKKTCIETIPESIFATWNWFGQRLTSSEYHSSLSVHTHQPSVSVSILMSS